jgi:hypothetical protein
VDVKRHHKKYYDQPPATNGQGDIPGGILINENNAAQTSGNHISNGRGNSAGRPARSTRTTANRRNGNGAAATNRVTTPPFRRYLFEEGNWRYLFATASGWFFLDIAFYGLGISSPRQLGDIWANSSPAKKTAPDWEDPFDPNTTIYWQLYDSAKEYVHTICFGSLAGSVLLLLIIDYIPRKTMLVLSFFMLSALLVITGVLFATVEFVDPSHWATVVFYAFCTSYLVCPPHKRTVLIYHNAGPNTLTFIVSPTRLTFSHLRD